MFQYNVRTLDRTTADISDIDRRLRELGTARLGLDAELGMTNPHATRAASTGEYLMSLREQIAVLNREYEQKSTRFHDAHPDLVSVKKQIATLQEQLVENSNEGAQGSASNPTFILLRTRLEATKAEIASLQAKRQELEEKADKFQAHISRSPSVEIEYNIKVREFRNAQSKYQDVRAKQREAELSENMEQERKGERFVMVEPPSLPIDPSSPNRPAIALIGLILAFGAGTILALTLEALDHAVYDERTLTRLSGAPPFASVGYIETNAELSSGNKSKRRLILLGVAAALAAVLAIHFLVKPLDVLWYILLAKIGL